MENLLKDYQIAHIGFVVENREKAMARLSERERQILALRYSDGKTQMEVSSEIGISQAQVSRLEKNAIKSIKKNM